MKKVNYHTHTCLCRHAGGTEADYVQAALDAGMEVLGFSDHAPYPDGRYGLRMDYGELEPHMERLRGLQGEYRERLVILRGLEIEYAPQDHRYYEDLLGRLGAEYLLLGQHYFYTASGELMNTYFIERTGDTSYYIDYAKSLADAMETGYFRAVAHPDLFFINQLPADKNCERACDMILDAAVRTGTIMEFNANGIRRGAQSYPDGVRYPYPHRMFWEKARAAAVPVIVNSDCHDPSKLWDSAMEEGYRLAEAWGCRLTDRIGI